MGGGQVGAMETETKKDKQNLTETEDGAETKTRRQTDRQTDRQRDEGTRDPERR